MENDKQYLIGVQGQAIIPKALDTKKRLATPALYVPGHRS